MILPLLRSDYLRCFGLSGCHRRSSARLRLAPAPPIVICVITP